MSVTNPSGSEVIAALKSKANELAELIEALPERRRSVALTQLETASTGAVKAAAVGDGE